MLKRERISRGISSICSESDSKSSSGKAQCPCDLASASTREIPALARVIEVFGIPSLWAIPSAVRKPMPRITPYLIVSNVSFAYIHAGYAEIFEITMD